MGQHQGADVAGGGDLAHGVAAGQCVLGQIAEMLGVDFSVRQVAALDQYVRALREAPQPRAIDGVAADGDDFPLALHPVSVANPALEKRLGEGQPMSVHHGLGENPPAVRFRYRAGRHVDGLDRGPAAMGGFAVRTPFDVLVVDLRQQGVHDALGVWRPAK
ncbi:hypothetical protein D9M72_400850 [compost metagenome]